MATNAAATSTSNQRKLDRASNGNLVTVYADTTTNGVVRVSTDGGLTWASGGADIAGFANGSMFIDLDDFLHVCWKQSGTGGGRTDGYIYFMRGVPNAARTAWTFGAAFTASGNANDNYPDLIVHREGTGWAAHVVQAFVSGSTSNVTGYWRIGIAADGTLTTTQAPVAISENYGTNVHTFPSIDFNHTGDGKTVAGGTPHLYVGWSAGKAGAGFGIRFRKAVYSAGSWTWNAEREIDPNIYNDHVAGRWIASLFDGTRVVIAGQMRDASVQRLVMFQRDAADTTTTTLHNEGTGEGQDGSFTYDASGNLYLVGWNTAGTGVMYRKYTRSTSAFASAVHLDQQVNRPHVSAKRGYGHNRIEWVYTSGNNSPYSVKYDQLSASLGYYVPQIML